MAKKKRPSRRYVEPLQTRVTTEQLDMFRAAAEKDGRTVSSWVRDRLHKAARRELSR